MQIGFNTFMPVHIVNCTIAVVNVISEKVLRGVDLC